jgi:hypothetical protein
VAGQDTQIEEAGRQGKKMKKRERLEKRTRETEDYKKISVQLRIHKQGSLNIQYMYSTPFCTVS